MLGQDKHRLVPKLQPQRQGSSGKESGPQSADLTIQCLHCHNGAHCRVARRESKPKTLPLSRKMFIQSLPPEQNLAGLHPKEPRSWPLFANFTSLKPLSRSAWTIPDGLMCGSQPRLLRHHLQWLVLKPGCPKIATTGSYRHVNQLRPAPESEQRQRGRRPLPGRTLELRHRSFCFHPSLSG